MKAVVYLGPSLPLQRARSELDCEYLPPVRRGDILRAMSRGTKVIGIVDGCFRSSPSILHKEILWAIDKGCRVFGAASMGALRAAELHDFGMIGIGRIFDDYLSGAIERDDEVAVEHAPAELGFVPSTVPLINIRYTLRAAVASEILAPDIAARVTEIAADIFYAKRTFRHLLETYVSRFNPSPSIRDALRAVFSNPVDQKAIDAVALLNAMRLDITQPLAEPFRGFVFEDTHFFSEIRAIFDNPILAGR